MSELDNLIPAEISNDELYYHIIELAKDPTIKNVLEIGSSCGQGSTEAFVKGITQNPSKVNLFCLEVSIPRFNKLKDYYKDLSFIHCYNMSSVFLGNFPTKGTIIDFYNTNQTVLNNYPLDLVLSWLKQDISYINENSIKCGGIKYIKDEHCIQYFDVVLIDGSEFLGGPEFTEVYDSNILILDDINSFKNYYNYRELCINTCYNLIYENKNLRNGYAIFKKNTI